MHEGSENPVEDRRPSGNDRQESLEAQTETVASAHKLDENDVFDGPTDEKVKEQLPFSLEESLKIDYKARFHRGAENQTSSKPRMLCLHGRGSNNQITEMQMLVFADTVACDFFQASFECAPPAGLLMMTNGPSCTWIDTRSTDKDANVDAANKDSNKDASLTGSRHEDNGDSSLFRSLAEVRACIKRYGPYDGLYGFSQGGLLVTLLSSAVVLKSFFQVEVAPWNFVVCACAAGQKRIPQRYRHLWPLLWPEEPERTGEADTISIPSLHIMGATDKEHLASSRLLTACFQTDLRSEFVHATGHVLPLTLGHDKKFVQTFQDFLASSYSQRICQEH